MRFVFVVAAACELSVFVSICVDSWVVAIKSASKTGELISQSSAKQMEMAWESSTWFARDHFTIWFWRDWKWAICLIAQQLPKKHLQDDTSPIILSEKSWTLKMANSLCAYSSVLIVPGATSHSKLEPQFNAETTIPTWIIEINFEPSTWGHL